MFLTCSETCSGHLGVVAPSREFNDKDSVNLGSAAAEIWNLGRQAPISHAFLVQYTLGRRLTEDFIHQYRLGENTSSTLSMRRRYYFKA